MEHGEAPEEAAVRECLEETGIVAVVRGKLSTFDNADTEGRPIRFHTVTFALEAIGPVDSVRLSPLEHDEYRWATLAEATAELDLVWHVRRTLELLRAFR